MKTTNPTPHIPVLLEEVVRVLNPQAGQTYFDGTAGFGGHAAAILSYLAPTDTVTLVDQDGQAVSALTERFSDRAEIIHGNFADVAAEKLAAGTSYDMILLDLGVSSPQFDNLERGFSFRGSADLDMRMDQNQPMTAADVVNTYPEVELARIIYEYGEERRSRAIARAIVAARPLTRTDQLADIVRRIVRRSGDHDPATRTFQALRIEVNHELERLSSALPTLCDLLNPDGRLAIISFHSLEDRIVKRYFEIESRDCICPPRQPICTCDHTATLAKLTAKPILGQLHDANNPRARSATLRAVRKLKPKQKETTI